MRVAIRTALLAATGFLAVGSCEKAPPALRVAAASSLRGVLERTAPLFEERHGTSVRFSFDASSAHARQLLAGAPFDVFLSADAVNVERVARRLAPGEPTTFLSNRLALVAHRGSPGTVSEPAALASTAGPIAIAGPEVPVGRYARAWLSAHGLGETLAPRFVSGRSARATLALVESGAAAHGFVYASDARATQRAELVWTAEADREPRIRYVGARLAGAREPLAAEFLRFLLEEEFQSGALEAGFRPVGS